MDYVKETLERQNAVWTALFVGSEEIEQGEQENPGRENRARQDGQSGRTQVAEREETLYEGENRSAEWRSFEEGFLTKNEGLQEMESVLRREEARLLQETARQRRAERYEQADVRETAAKRADFPEEGAQWERENTKAAAFGAAGMTDAQEISRRFERDARRYDGGFIFY